MLYAKTKESEKIEAYPNAKAICPSCDNEVISKCGEIKVWHWAHKNLTECDSWSEGETIWHKQWKDIVPKENREVVISKKTYCESLLWNIIDNEYNIKLIPSVDKVCSFCKCNLFIGKYGNEPGYICPNCWRFEGMPYICKDNGTKKVQTTEHPEQLMNRSDFIDMEAPFIPTPEIKKHRADIKNNNGMVTELQNSRISTSEIREREVFYDNMIWLFNGIPFVDNLQITNSFEKYNKKYYHFRWKWFNKSIMSCNKNVYFDFGIDRYKSGIFRVTKFTPKGITGYFMQRNSFIWFINNGGKK